MLGWSQLPNKTSPLLFRHVDGEEARDEDSPSWHNPAEKAEVMNIIYDLLQSKLATPEDIGVITPYQKQMQKIKSTLHYNTTQLKKRDRRNIRVGTAELFQGMERPIIIISTVRSHRRYLLHDHQYLLGFVSSPQRMNVAISRAQSLLVIIGNASLLSVDPLWKQLLQSIDSQGGYQGPDLTQLCSDTDCTEVPEINFGSNEEACTNQDAPWRNEI